MRSANLELIQERIEKERNRQCRLGYTEQYDDELTPAEWITK